MSNPEQEDHQHEEEPEVAISSFKVKPPVFSETSVPTWFRILEAQFHLGKITSERSKYFQALSHLPTDVVNRLSPTDLDALEYSRLKKAVIAIYEKSKTEMFTEFMAKQTYSGKPSLHLREMLSYGSKLKIGEDIIRMQFLKSMPNTIRPTLASQTSLSLDQLGELANDLVALIPSTPVMAISSTKKPPTTEVPIGLRPFHKDQKPRMCRAHIYYAAYARTCKPWCKYPDKTNVQIRPSSRPPSRSSSPVPSEN